LTGGCYVESHRTRSLAIRTATSDEVTVPVSRILGWAPAGGLAELLASNRWTWGSRPKATIAIPGNGWTLAAIRWGAPEDFEDVLADVLAYLG
jgi:hypothetical protein